MTNQCPMLVFAIAMPLFAVPIFPLSTTDRINYMQSFLGFIFAFIVGSFLEYWVHRFMHRYPKFGNGLTGHYGHHRSNTTKGFVRDWLDFSLVSLLVLPAFLISQFWGIIMISGTVAFAAFASYAHQIQHYNPHKCFWMKMPIHYIHHKNNQWDSNFGLAIDWWDIVFGTYKPVEWLSRERCDPALCPKRFLQDISKCIL